ncbi:hypothetical protein PAESOLCIP111_00398 [Paenibacillus solanacearum]|uniref:Uncharacterized protein n=1 Tax=Paenibacillus solanacearum TaxID=2048548 RepID=A0A916JUR4_9BACL|nr:hypothetical protein [Paenibacillus solanacearum]CAG7600455.1 hypothetical protein PAESOLCIP111_00398 [Paenibacillus solanacearum]
MHFLFGYAPSFSPKERPTPSTDPSDVSQFQYSAKQGMMPAADMSKLLHTISTQSSFALRLKKAAAESNKPAVKHLIQSLGIQTPFEVTVTPDGMAIDFKSSTSHICYELHAALCW